MQASLSQGHGVRSGGIRGQRAARARVGAGPAGDRHRRRLVEPVTFELGVRDRTQAVVFAYEAGIVRPGG
jgi:hypothetical protein